MIHGPIVAAFIRLEDKSMLVDQYGDPVGITVAFEPGLELMLGPR